MDLFAEFFQHVRDLGEQVVENATKVVFPPSPLDEALADALTGQHWGCSKHVYAQLLRALSYRGPQADKVYISVQNALSVPPDKWMEAFKAILFIEYVLGHGDQSLVENMASLSYYIDRAQNICVQNEKGQEFKAKAARVMELIKNKNKLAEYKQECAEREQKYVGISNMGSVCSGPNLPNPPSASGFGMNPDTRIHTPTEFQNSVFGGPPSHCSSADPFDEWDGRCKDTSSEGAYITKAREREYGHEGNQNTIESIDNMGDPFEEKSDHMKAFMIGSDDIELETITQSHKSRDTEVKPQKEKNEGLKTETSTTNISNINLLD